MIVTYFILCECLNSSNCLGAIFRLTYKHVNTYISPCCGSLPSHHFYTHLKESAKSYFLTQCLKRGVLQRPSLRAWKCVFAVGDLSIGAWLLFKKVKPNWDNTLFPVIQNLKSKVTINNCFSDRIRRLLLYWDPTCPSNIWGTGICKGRLSSRIWL